MSCIAFRNGVKTFNNNSTMSQQVLDISNFVKLFASQESHSDGRILSDSDGNLIGFHKEFNKTMKSYGIPGDGSTVGS